jgi:hypothetical protein
MRTQNKILADIVTANGGIVTNPQSRNSLLNDWLDAIGYVRIHFALFDPVQQSNLLFSADWVAAGNFSVSADTILPLDATDFALLGQSASTANYLKVLSTGFLSFSIDSSVVTSTVLATKDSKLRNYGVTLSGNDFIFTEKGVAVDTVTDAVAAAKTLTLNTVGQSSAASYFKGVEANVKLDDLSQSGNTFTFPINTATGTTEDALEGGLTATYHGIPEANRPLFTLGDGKWVGEELVVNGDFATDTYWVKNGNWTIAGGKATANEVSNALLYQSNNFSEGTYIDSFSISDYVSGTVRINSGGGGAPAASNGAYSETRGASADTFFRMEPSFTSGFVGTIDDVSRKKVLEIA